MLKVYSLAGRKKNFSAQALVRLFLCIPLALDLIIKVGNEKSFAKAI